MSMKRRTNKGYGYSTGGGEKEGKATKEKAAAAASTEEKTPAAKSGNKQSLKFAIGGVVMLLGVAGYTFLRQPGNGAAISAGHAQYQPTQTLLESVATKRYEARQRLDALEPQKRKEEAGRLGMLTEEEVDAVLGAKESAWSVRGAQGARIRVDACQVSSNDPIEDYMMWRPLGSESTEAAQYMFGVFDGHAGYLCAEQIAARIGPMLDASLGMIGQAEAQKPGSKDLSQGSKDLNPGNKLQSTIAQLRREAGLDWDHTSLALTATFINMDYELVEEALKQYRKLQDASKMDELLGPAVSGSCGLVAVVDTERNEVVVGNTGDSRALLGVRLNNGTWKAVRLSEDQTGATKSEIARMQREHPGEDDSVVSDGRVLGSLMPSRAFGDCRYKWPLAVQQKLFPMLFARGHRYATTPPNFLTPPYVTAKPVIVRHQLNQNDKFIVMASDGLYDQLSDAEVVDAVAQWYEANGPAKDGASTLMTRDKNAATHLIRTALSTDRMGRRSDSLIRRLLAIPPPHSRRFRDDISVTIVTLDSEKE
ncbi:[Pyruvate dehydrogenase [acetyl-transferring]]-phosphatase 1, mitochondrial [Coemansia sp. RSA 2399]|nr:[Pyruvate dehydrogenase [acetyl-transferring]]-phosphatase 1, mitochondrial [Coemansia sp. RSA 2399]KAJ1907615.1 [Pyruvate dehydrogenase [acetyl-transferring]]-phosphatase 1, mitochondrial [Coemansia sp. IMI 209127]